MSSFCIQRQVCLCRFENDRRRRELAIHCALNRVDKSTDIEPLGLNLARRRESACIQAERRQTCGPVDRGSEADGEADSA
jgi:hypothetical protein